MSEHVREQRYAEVIDAELAEARATIARVEALAAEWKACGSGYGVPDPSWSYVERELRAVLEANR